MLGQRNRFVRTVAEYIYAIFVAVRFNYFFYLLFLITTFPSTIDSNSSPAKTFELLVRQTAGTGHGQLRTK